MTTLQLAGGRKDTEVEENGGDTLQSRPTSLLSPRTSRPGLHLGEKVRRRGGPQRQIVLMISIDADREVMSSLVFEHKWWPEVHFHFHL